MSEGALREKLLRRISENIREHGYHVYLISAGATPRYVYTIGLNEKIGFDLIFAGGLNFSASSVKEVVERAFRILERASGVPKTLEIPGYGCFDLARASDAWVQAIALGALDFYGSEKVEMVQLIPPRAKLTIDVPRMDSPVAPQSQRGWRWLAEPWPYSLSIDSSVAIDLEALFGRDIVYVSRWPDDEWEMFAGDPESVSEQCMRVVNFSFVLAIDPTIEAILCMEDSQVAVRTNSESKWEIQV